MDTVFLALRVIVSLAVVVAAIWFVQKRVGRGSRGKRADKAISVISKQGVGSKASVAVIEYDGRQFLLGVTEHGVSLLDSVAVPASVVAATEALAEPAEAAPTEAQPDFAAALTRAQADDANEIGYFPESAGLASANLAASAAHVPPSKLAGSILSASTWKQAFVAFRGAR